MNVEKKKAAGIDAGRRTDYVSALNGATVVRAVLVVRVGVHLHARLMYLHLERSPISAAAQMAAPPSRMNVAVVQIQVWIVLGGGAVIRGGLVSLSIRVGLAASRHLRVQIKSACNQRSGKEATHQQR